MLAFPSFLFTLPQPADYTNPLHIEEDALC